MLWFAVLVLNAHDDLLVLVHGSGPGPGPGLGLDLGPGPGGQKAAIAAAKLGRTSAVIERRHRVGGVCINTGTIPSKTLREAVLYLTGLNMRDLYGQSYRVKDDITVQDLLSRTTQVIGRETEVIRNQLFCNRVDLHHGTGRFLDDRTLAVRAPEGDTETHLTADKILIAVGTQPARPSSVQFDDRRVVVNKRRAVSRFGA